jgi:hypothetical protein
LGIMFLYTESLTKMLPFLNNLSFLSLFHFYRPGEILIHNNFFILNPIILIIISVIFLFTSIIVFTRRDIYI